MSLLRSCGLLLFEVNGCNPNGDPDNDGLPRKTPTNLGWVTDVAMKRKYRDVLEDHDSPIFQDIVKMCKINPERFYIEQSHMRGLKLADPVEAAKAIIQLAATDHEKFLDMLWDVRAFGSALLEQNPDKKKKNEVVRFLRTGVITMTPAFSIAPIFTVRGSITKKSPYREELLKAGNGDIAPGGRSFVEHGLYACRVTVNPHVARHTRTTVEDIEVFKKLSPFIFNPTSSASRPGGSIRIVHFWWRDHTNSLGSFNEFEFFEKLMPRKLEKPNEPSSSLADYYIPKPSEMGLEGVTDIGQIGG